MSNRSLKEYFDELEAGIIEDLIINTFTNQITIVVRVIENKNETVYKLVFSKVVSYYYVNDSRDRRFEIEEPDYLEFTSIEYFENGLGEISIISEKEHWVKQYGANANFAIEIWNSMLLIEAGAVSVNGASFAFRSIW